MKDLSNDASRSEAIIFSKKSAQPKSIKLTIESKKKKCFFSEKRFLTYKYKTALWLIRIFEEKRWGFSVFVFFFRHSIGTSSSPIFAYSARFSRSVSWIRIVLRCKHASIHFIYIRQQSFRRSFYRRIVSKAIRRTIIFISPHHYISFCTSFEKRYAFFVQRSILFIIRYLPSIFDIIGIN